MSERTSLLARNDPPPTYASIWADDAADAQNVPVPPPNSRTNATVPPNIPSGHGSVSSSAQGGPTRTNARTQRKRAFAPFALRPRGMSGTGGLLILFSLILVMTTLGTALYVVASRPQDILDPVERENIRREWLRERKNHESEHQQWLRERAEFEQFKVLRTREKAEYALEVETRVRQRREWEKERRRQEDEWEKERRRYEEEREKERRRHEMEWEKERRRHEEEDQRWEKEKWERMQLYWGDLWRNGKCHSYGTREYTARLWNIAPGANGIEACMQKTIKINNQVVLPTECEDRVCFPRVFCCKCVPNMWMHSGT
jgi:hypothetical protein